MLTKLVMEADIIVMSEIVAEKFYTTFGLQWLVDILLQRSVQ